MTKVIEPEISIDSFELTPTEKARDMVVNFGKYIGREIPNFQAYFMKDGGPNEEVEEEFVRLLGLEPDTLLSTAEPTVVLQREDTLLYRWSNFIDGEPIDVYYEASRGEAQPLLYARWQD